MSKKQKCNNRKRNLVQGLRKLGGNRKKRKVYHLKMSVEERRRYQNNYQNDKNRVKREVWEGKEYTTHHKERAKVKTARKKVKQNQSKLNRFNKYYGLK